MLQEDNSQYTWIEIPISEDPPPRDRIIPVLLDRDEPIPVMAIRSKDRYFRYRCDYDGETAIDITNEVTHWLRRIPID